MVGDQRHGPVHAFDRLARRPWLDRYADKESDLAGTRVVGECLHRVGAELCEECSDGALALGLRLGSSSGMRPV